MNFLERTKREILLSRPVSLIDLAKRKPARNRKTIGWAKEERRTEADSAPTREARATPIKPVT